MTSPERTKRAPTPQKAYLVLGMHRSGTSAATQLLALAGAQLPDNVMPGDEHNARGYFEPWRVAVFNDRRLRAGGGAWDDPFAFPYRPTPDEAGWRSEAAELFRREYRGAKTPLLKDPRVSVLMPLWRPVLEGERLSLRCVIPVRHPLAVAGSLERRDQFPTAKSVLLWMTYMLAAEVGSRDLPRAFLDYDSLLADWRPEVARLEAALGEPLPNLTDSAGKKIDAFLSPELRHNSGAGDMTGLGQLGNAAQAVYDWFQTAAHGAQPDPVPLTRAAALLAQMQADFGVYVSPVTQALDAAKADLADARRALAFEVDRNGELVAHGERTQLKLESEIRRLIAERAAIEGSVDALLAAR